MSENPQPTFTDEGAPPLGRRFSLSGYLPLKEKLHTQEFRIIKLEHDHAATVSCSIHRYKIHHAPRYRALSYTWKSPFAHTEDDEDREDILVGGEKVSVGKNLANALRALRDWHHEDDTSFIWADAICIDQYDPYERAYQVAIMGEIFSKAHDVFIWLGEEAEDSDRAIHFLKSLAKLYRDRNASQVLQLARDKRYEQQWTALQHLWSRRWWSRAWVLQEVVLARDGVFACGRATLPLASVFDSSAIMQEVYEDLYPILQETFQITLRMPTFHVLDGMQKIIKARHEGILFPMVLCHFRTMSPRCTNPRDHIFAKMGMASDGHTVEPSYTDTVAQVYTNFVRKQVEESGSLDVIHVDGRPRNFPDLPSWVPDWSAEYAASPCNPDHAGDPRIKFPYSNASLGEKADVVSDDHNGGLVCKGYLFDRIDGVARYEENSWAGKEAPRPAHQPKKRKNAYKNDNAMFDALWRSLVLNQERSMEALHPGKGVLLARNFQAACSRVVASPDGSPAAAPTSRFEKYCSLLHDFEILGKTVLQHMHDAMDDSSASAQVIPKWDDAEEAMAHWYLFRRLFTTEEGFIGVAPPEAEPGDTIAILLGCSVPMVLRRDDDGDFRVIGEAYVHGIMYGEGLQALRESGLAIMSLRLI